MKKITFQLEISCWVGWNDDEDTALLAVDTFSEVVRTATVLEQFENARFANDKKHIRDEYQEIKEALVTESGEEISNLGCVMGLRCIYEDDKGIQVTMQLSDNFGTDGTAKIDSAAYDNEYRKLLGQSKSLAAEILKL